MTHDHARPGTDGHGSNAWRSVWRCSWSKGFVAGCASRHWTEGDLCRAVDEMKRGLIDADLGHGLRKKRIARSGSGKRGGYRAIVANRHAGSWFFVHGYAKNRRVNLDPNEIAMCRAAAMHWLDQDAAGLKAAVDRGDISEVACDA
ncbi:type II toxin-antitoxin system RelE/ParE family toxin [Mitsuaria sp. 7]|uniref:type II toxin-antitoxin system RelE/ParE family toxin n=1 Tax=Mitsuaria sp. 7 TaxID=1658665 RepID=UPI002101CE65|nr:type II toxin-antitoxin system RelE/ParE family toxin [Mitsuaria sp. 7]